MKKLIIFCFILSSLWSCSLDSNNFINELVPIESVSMPDMFLLEADHTIEYTYYRPTTCHGFYDLYYVTEDNELTIAVINIVFDTDCEPLEDNLIEKTFPFKPLHTGTYIFKFWQGLDENDDNQYLVYEITVEE